MKRILYWYQNGSGIVVTILILLLIFIAYQTNNRNQQAQKHMFFNKKAVIVAVGEQQGPDHSKFHKPVEYYKILVRDLQDTTLFLEWETTKEKYYNYKINDTVSFTFINKYRWFHITK